jgi:hypothetical protein
MVKKRGIDRNGRPYSRMVHQDAPGGGEGDATADPLAAMLGGGGEPSAPGDVDTPDVGAASGGSLPGKVSKSVQSYFARLVAEVCV